MKDGKLITLAIESSCDETSVALVKDGREVLSNVISSQIEVHKVFGGVVPEIASRHHLNNINRVTAKAFEEAGLGWEDVDLIGVTKGPGLVGALVVGIATAKAFAFAKDKPLVGVHHIQGHIAANYIEHRDLEPPFMALVISGGHTSLVDVEGYGRFKVLGSTRDDAAGEAYDKVARVLGLGYPGGPLIDKLALRGNPEKVFFKRVFLEKDSLDFSFSGVKTGVLNYINTEKQAGREINTADVASGFQLAVMEVVVEKAIRATELQGRDKLVMAGGVAANSCLRRLLSEACKKKGIGLYYPSPLLCTDNAAMIGCEAHYQYLEKGPDGLDLDAYANLDIGEKIR